LSGRMIYREYIRGVIGTCVGHTYNHTADFRP